MSSGGAAVRDDGKIIIAVRTTKNRGPFWGGGGGRRGHALLTSLTSPASNVCSWRKQRLAAATFLVQLSAPRGQQSLTYHELAAWQIDKRRRCCETITWLVVSKQHA